MLFKKIVLSSALLSIAGLVACGDDSSSNSGDDKLPEKVKTIQDANSLKCDESVKCAKVFVEEEMVNDYFQCDGERWQPATDAKFKDLCPAEEEKKAEGDEGGDNDGSSDSKGSSTETSTDSQGTSTDSGDNGTSSDSGAATSTDSNTETSSASEEASSSSEEVTGPTGDLVSCTIEAEGIMGGKTCDEYAKSNEAAVQSQCDMFGGTRNTNGGCSQENVMKKCPSENVNHYIYNGSKDDTCPSF